MRIAAKIDKNQPEIVEALRQVGASVQILARVGDGCPDLLVGFRGRNILMEVKDPGRDEAKYRNRETHRVLTQDQVKWFCGWNGSAVVVWDVDEALEAIGAKNG